MPPPAQASPPPLVLIASDHEWAARSLDSVLSPRGFTVVRTNSDYRAVELAGRMHPDAILIDTEIGTGGGLETCRVLRDDPIVGAITPIMVISHSAGGRSDRVQAYAAGAWDFCVQPIDGDVLLLKLGTFVRSKRVADALRKECFIDELTGLYNARGLARRASEIGASVTRLGSALACVVFSAALDDANAPEGPGDAAAQRVAGHVGEICRRHGRLSDAIGRLDNNEFAVVAPSTDERGVLRMMHRLKLALESTPMPGNGEGPTIRVAMGYRALADFSTARTDPMDLVREVASDLHRPPRVSEPSATARPD